jgi:hypothetical protein
MNNWLNPLIDSSIQCWGCPIFDRLFVVVSNAAAATYNQFVFLCILIFCLVLSFYILYAVWKNIRGGVTDSMYQKYLKPVIINSVFVFALLGMGVWLPRFITTLTFEPVANMTLLYTQSMINIDSDTVNEKVSYEPAPMNDDGFFRPQLRDKIIMLIKTTITQFQSYIKLGIAVIDNAFSWSALFGIGALVKHIIMLFVGFYLAYGFFKTFIRFCFYFVDIIVAMTFFAFLFPLSLVMFAFKESEAPDWVKKIGSSLGAGHFKKLVSAIISLSAAVLTYTVIMTIIAKFFSGDVSTAQLMQMITSGDIFADKLSDDNLAMMSLSGCIVLIYIVNFLADQVGKVTDMVMSTFDVKDVPTQFNEKKTLGGQLGDDVIKFTENVGKSVKDTTKTLLGGADKKDDKKDEKKDEKK